MDSDKYIQNLYKYIQNLYKYIQNLSKYRKMGSFLMAGMANTESDLQKHPVKVHVVTKTLSESYDSGGKMQFRVCF